MKYSVMRKKVKGKFKIETPKKMDGGIGLSAK